MALMVNYVIGGLLLLWVLYDLASGEVWLHRAFKRADEPISYWVLMLVWLLVALSFFVYPWML